MKRRTLVGTILVTTAVAIGGAAAPHVLEGNVGYHRLQYELADAVVSRGLSINWAGELLFEPKLRALLYAVDRKDYHRQRLIALGAMVCCRFEFKNIKQGSRESDHLWRTCYSQVAPGFDDLTFWNCTPVHIAVWCAPSNRAPWERFVARYDVPNYWEVRDLSVVPTGPLQD